MFVQGTATEVESQLQKLDGGRSILDAVAGQARDLQRGLPARDRDRLDQYFTSVRELEERMRVAREWELKPKPKPPAEPPTDPASPRDYMEKVKLMYDIAARLRDRFDPLRYLDAHWRVNSPVIELGETEAHRRLPQPLAPRQIGGEDGPAQGDR